jgi:hypothetical protein
MDNLFCPNAVYHFKKEACMKYILLIGSIFNIVGGINILLSLALKFPFGFTEIPPAAEIKPPDYMQYRVFTAGTAFTFGAMYYYMFKNPEYAMPFLIFGMSLKFWAFLSSLIAFYRYHLPKDCFVSFGITNLFIAILFSIYLFA